eukprot:scaffold29647_cov145-Isochrysis_galbana.AAC.2
MQHGGQPISARVAGAMRAETRAATLVRVGSVWNRLARRPADTRHGATLDPAGRGHACPRPALRTRYFRLRAKGETRGAGGLGESLGALPRGAATCDDAAPSGAHASSTADHARILRQITAAT